MVRGSLGMKTAGGGQRTRLSRWRRAGRLGSRRATSECVSKQMDSRVTGGWRVEKASSEQRAAGQSATVTAGVGIGREGGRERVGVRVSVGAAWEREGGTARSRREAGGSRVGAGRSGEGVRATTASGGEWAALRAGQPAPAKRPPASQSQPTPAPAPQHRRAPAPPQTADRRPQTAAPQHHRTAALS